ncbi:UNVERIFIED_CONTAM: hypothetical protein FKN15_003656 [Acipenser sinensis]
MQYYQAHRGTVQGLLKLPRNPASVWSSGWDTVQSALHSDELNISGWDTVQSALLHSD